MPITNYTELKNAINAWTDRSESDDQLDTFIAIAEARFSREVRIRDMILREPVAIVQRYTDLPADFLEARTLRLLTDPVIKLEQVPQSKLDELRSEGEGTPKFFSVHSQIEVDRPPDQAYTGELVYWEKLRALSGTNTTNALLQRAPDLYLYGCLAATAPFLMHDERVQLWESMYQDARDRLNRLDQKTFGPTIARVAGMNP